MKSISSGLKNVLNIWVSYVIVPLVDITYGKMFVLFNEQVRPGNGKGTCIRHNLQSESYVISAK